jgi:hypothetical protein
MSSLDSSPEKDGYIMTVRMYNEPMLIDMIMAYQLTDAMNDDHTYYGPDSLVQKYINDHLKIWINGNRVEAELSSKEIVELETLMTLFLPYKRNVKEIRIENQILTSLFNDQVNLFIYKDKELEKAIKFTNSHTIETLFKE